MKRILLFAILTGVLLLTACINRAMQPVAVRETDSILIAKTEVLTSRVLTADEQAQLTPAQVIDMLKTGNSEFTQDLLTVRNNTQRVREAALGQWPKAVILSCLDSRVPVEDVFHCGIGDLFVARVAGNIANPDILGSLEYACKVSGSKAVVVLGHEDCGAIESAISDVRLGNITGLLARIKPAISQAAKGFEGDMTAQNAKFVTAVCRQNVENVVTEIRVKSPILKEMEIKGEIIIIGAVYDMETGVVHFFDQDK